MTRPDREHHEPTQQTKATTKKRIHSQTQQNAQNGARSKRPIGTKTPQEVQNRRTPTGHRGNTENTRRQIRPFGRTQEGPDPRGGGPPRRSPGHPQGRMTHERNRLKGRKDRFSVPTASLSRRLSRFCRVCGPPANVTLPPGTGTPRSCGFQAPHPPNS